MNATQNLIDTFEQGGKIWQRGALSEAELSLLDAAAALSSKPGQRLDFGAELRQVFAANSQLMQAITPLDPDAKPVRIITFNKSRNNNWGVPWHQDRVISLANKHSVDGFHNWTKKSDKWHCEPPITILENMLFVRVHLDDTDSTNGAMQIAIGSHKQGIVSSQNAAKLVEQYPIEDCTAKRGDVLILKMLTLHRSKPSKRPSDRRVFRIDFASCDLPAPLEWG